MKAVVLTAGAILLCGCSSAPPDVSKKAPDAPSLRVPASSNPAARHLELVGFRVSERTPGKLQIQFGVVNHSDADLGDISLNISLRTTSSKESEAPLVEFQTKVAALGPQDLKPVSVEVPSKLRPYELPDWQFLRADFRLGEPK
jgi:hypothetical protein